MKPCIYCDGDGYTEEFNANQTDVIIEVCKFCAGTGVENAGVEI